MRNQTIKTHIYFHLPKCIEIWGPPAGWDLVASESHHKTEIKAPAKTRKEMQVPSSNKPRHVS